MVLERFALAKWRRLFYESDMVSLLFGASGTLEAYVLEKYRE